MEAIRVFVFVVLFFNHNTMKRLLGSTLLLAILASTAPLTHASPVAIDRVRLASDTLGNHYYTYGTQDVVATGFSFRPVHEDIMMQSLTLRVKMDVDNNGSYTWGSENLDGNPIYANEIVSAVRLIDLNSNEWSSWESIDSNGYVEFDDIEFLLQKKHVSTLYLELDLSSRDLNLEYPLSLYFDIENVHQDIVGENPNGENRNISANHPNFPNGGASQIKVTY